jgi:hypothetical protein
MEDNAPVNPILEQLKKYAENKIKLIKYEVIDQSSLIIAELATDLIVVVLALVTFLFFSVTLALFVGYLLSSYWEGFACVTLLYAAILFAARLLKVSIQNNLIGVFIKKVFKKKLIR